MNRSTSNTLNRLIMNIDPYIELSKKFSKLRHPAWSYCSTAVMIALLLLWSFLCRSCVNGDGSGGLNGGNGTLISGSGTGSGDHGKGRGAGKSGDGSGKEKASGRIGLGKNNDEPQTTPAGENSRQATPQQQVINLPASQVFAQSANVESIKQLAPPKVKTPTSQNTGGAPSGVSGIAGSGFYGVRAGSNARVLFLVDMSGSMGGRASGENGKTQMDVLKNELYKSIFGSAKKIGKANWQQGGFIIAAFDDMTKVFPEKKICRYKDKNNMKEAAKFIASIYPRGGTGFKQAWKNSVKLIKENDIDIVYFLTDGAGDADDKWILELLKKEVSKKLVVNCISLGADRKFMEKIAKKRKGKYVCLK